MGAITTFQNFGARMLFAKFVGFEIATFHSCMLLLMLAQILTIEAHLLNDVGSIAC